MQHSIRDQRFNWAPNFCFTPFFKRSTYFHYSFDFIINLKADHLPILCNLSLIKLKSLSPSPWIISRRNFLHSDQLITHLFDCFNLELVITLLTNSCYWCFDEFTVFEPPSLVSVMNECYTIFIHDTDSVNRLNFRSIFILCYVFFLFLLIQYDQYNFVDAHSPKIISIYFPPRNKKMQSNKKTNSFFIDVIGSNLDNLLRAVRSQMKVLFGADFL